MVKRHYVSHEMGNVLRALRGEGLDVAHSESGRVAVRGLLNGRAFLWMVPGLPRDREDERIMVVGLARALRDCGVAEPPPAGLTMLDLDASPSDIWWAIWSWEEDLDGGPIMSPSGREVKAAGVRTRPT